LRSAHLIQAYNFPVEDSILGAALQRKSKIQRGKGLDLVPVAGDQPPMAIFEVCQGAKAVPLDLKEPLTMGKGPRRTANRHGLKMRQHLSNNKGFLAAVFKKGQTWFSRSGKHNDPSMSAIGI
jgi:hypothetical protein